MDRDTLLGALRNAAAAGLTGSTVIDVGAASGTPSLYTTFPAAKHLLVEPLAEFQDHLANIVQRIDGVVFAGTAGAEPGEAVFNVHEDLSGSSLLKEAEGGGVDGRERIVPQSTLDHLVADYGFVGPFIVKVDTQGAELEVLKGASRVLSEAAFVVLEMSFHPFFLGGPEVVEVVEFMATRGLLPYDVVDLQYRPLDGALSQVDMAFVPPDSPLRRARGYATEAQRADHNEAFRRKNQSMSRG